MKAWHVWTIDQNRYRRIEDYIKDLSEIESYLYPLISKDYKVRGVKKTRDVPLYSNYMFLLYDSSSYLLDKLSACPWIKTYVGICSSKEIEDIKKLSKRKYEDLIPADELTVGCMCRMRSTPFIGMVCRIVEIDTPKLVVAVELFGLEKHIKCSIDDVNLEG